MSGKTVSEIKALWTYGKLDNGDLVVRKYKGSDQLFRKSSERRLLQN